MTYNLVEYIKRKIRYNKGVARSNNCVVTSHSTILTAVRFLKLSLYLAEKWMRDTVVLSFETENWMWLLRYYLKFLCELNCVD